MLDLSVLPLALPASLSGTLPEIGDRPALLIARRCRCEQPKYLSDELALALGQDGSLQLKHMLPGKCRILLPESDSSHRLRGSEFELHPGKVLELGVSILE